MAFTCKGEYERLLKIFNKCKEDGKDGIPFECGCACGYIEEVKLVPWHYDEDREDYVNEHIELMGRAGFDYLGEGVPTHLLVSLDEHVVSLPYYKRWYRYNKEFGIFEYFVRMRERMEGFIF